MVEKTQRCLYCEVESGQVPLVAFHFKGSQYWICSLHLPILIHEPAQLRDKLPGSQGWDAAEHAHHD